MGRSTHTQDLLAKGTQGSCLQKMQKNRGMENRKASRKECFIQGEENIVVVRAAAVRWDGAVTCSNRITMPSPFPSLCW